jgi:hydrogenase maturation factor HypE
MGKKQPTIRKRDPIDNVNANEKAFCLAYLANGGKQRDAAKVAYTCKNDVCADEIGNRTMARPRVVAFLNKMRESMGLDINGLSEQARKVIDELSLLSFSDPANYVDALQLPKEVCESIKDMGPERRAISEIEITTRRMGSEESPIIQQETKFKFHSKVTALTLLGKHHKLYVELIKHQVEKNCPDVYELPDNGMKEKA